MQLNFLSIPCPVSVAFQSLSAKTNSPEEGERVYLVKYMIHHRGVGRSSVITGSSIHNQQIERLWRDVYRVVVRQFKNLFYLEQYGLLDPLNENDLYALHIPRINRALVEFQRQHNHHPVSISLSPAQEMSAMQIDPLHNDTNYGIDMYTVWSTRKNRKIHKTNKSKQKNYMAATTTPLTTPQTPFVQSQLLTLMSLPPSGLQDHHTDILLTPEVEGYPPKALNRVVGGDGPSFCCCGAGEGRGWGWGWGWMSILCNCVLCSQLSSTEQGLEARMTLRKALRELQVQFRHDMCY